jgi:uncharacterized protein YjbI with pentapeptide repeats
MELITYWGEVIFALETAKTVAELVAAAHSAKKSLSGANLRGADLSRADLRGANLSGANLSGADLSGANLRGADLSGADLRGANLRGADLSRADLRRADLRGANLSRKKVHSMSVFTGLYRYEVWAVLFCDGTRWVRMGCLWKSLDEWERIGIRKSNPSQYPDDGSEKCEERVAAFEFAKASVLRMKLPDPPKE